MFFKPFTAGLELAGSVAMETYSEFVPFQPDRPRGRLERKYANGNSEFVEVDDARLHVRDEGPEDAPAVVLLHGTYSSLHTWDGWVEQLGDRFRLVRVDMPGFGLTGPRTEGPHTLGHLVETIGAFCDERSLSEIAVAGNSLGGAVAWRLATERPDLVSRLLLLNAGGATLLSELAQNIVAFGSDLVPRYMTPRMTIRVLINDAYSDTSKISNELVARYHDLLVASGNRRAVIEIARNYREHNFDENTEEAIDVRTPRLPSAYDPTPHVWDDYDIADVEIPTLFQWGVDDEWLPVHFGRELAADVPDSQFVTYEGVGHVPMEESPVETAKDAAVFLSGWADDSDDGTPEAVPV